jgi:two-component system phosphate regulon sensor histidine kinase PhoR
MTHELKTPISTIALSSEVIADPQIINEPERLQAYARIIRSENERLRNQVERVLQLATLDKDELQLKLEAVDMNQVAREVAEHFTLPLAERRVEMDLQVMAARSTVTGDRMHLANVVTNLLDNALKYGPDDSVIRMRTLQRGGEFLLTVEDQGIGIRKEDIKHIFERFYRVHTGNVHNVKGFGLGLHYVQQIAHAHNGGISVQSEPGKGSTFTLSLPLAQ